MSFEAIPEDRRPSFPCECGGEIIFYEDSGKWECNKCGFSKESQEGEVK